MADVRATPDARATLASTVAGRPQQPITGDLLDSLAQLRDRLLGMEHDLMSFLQRAIGHEEKVSEQTGAVGPLSVKGGIHSAIEQELAEGHRAASRVSSLLTRLADIA